MHRPQIVDDPVRNLARRSVSPRRQAVVARMSSAKALPASAAGRRWRTASPPSTGSPTTGALLPARAAARAWSWTSGDRQLGPGEAVPPAAARRSMSSAAGEALGLAHRGRRFPPAASISRAYAGAAPAPPRSAMESARACSRLSSSTRPRDIVGHGGQQRDRWPASSSRPARLAEASAILMLTSLSEQSTPAELSMKSGVDPPAAPGCAPASAYSMRPACVVPRSSALADHPRAHVRAVRCAGHRSPDRPPRRRPRWRPSHQCRCRRTTAGPPGALRIAVISAIRGSSSAASMPSKRAGFRPVSGMRFIERGEDAATLARSAPRS